MYTSRFALHGDLNLCHSHTGMAPQRCRPVLRPRVRNGVSDKDLNSPIGSASCTSASVEVQDPTSVKSKGKTWADVVKMATGQTV